jgi:L-threonylcarbamoyladenylate synthase
VALPTETVYGLAADALSAGACARIFEAKERPLSDPLIVHIPSIEWLSRIAVPSPLALTLAETFWPGPLTLVLPRQATIPDIVTAGQDTVAVRCPSHPLAIALLEACAARGVWGLVAPSANRFGRISPTTAAHVRAEFGATLAEVLDGGPG